MSSSDPNTAPVKQISITGGAVHDFNKTKGSRKKRTTRKLSAGEYSPNSQITFIPSEKTNPLQGGFVQAPVAPVQAPPPPPAPQATIRNNVPPQPPQEQQQPPTGGSTKLVLNPPKKRETRLLLKGPKNPHQKQGAQEKPTRKNVRKITLGLRGLTVKINRAKNIHKKVGDMKKDDIRKLLVEKGILKAGKKDPPEALMRQMYSDYLILTSKGL